MPLPLMLKVASVGPRTPTFGVGASGEVRGCTRFSDPGRAGWEKGGETTAPSMDDAGAERLAEPVRRPIHFSRKPGNDPAQ